MKKIILIISCVFSFISYSANFNESKGVLIEGYDPVAYFTKGRAVKGSDKISISYKGVQINFESHAHKKKFTKSPESYLPSYGGYCAYAMAKNGSTVSVNPKAFKISQGKLLLFYKNAFANTLKRWNRGSESKQIKDADSNWSSIIQ